MSADPLSLPSYGGRGRHVSHGVGDLEIAEDETRGRGDKGEVGEAVSTMRAGMVRHGVSICLVPPAQPTSDRVDDPLLVLPSSGPVTFDLSRYMLSVAVGVFSRVSQQHEKLDSSSHFERADAQRSTLTQPPTSSMASCTPSNSSKDSTNFLARTASRAFRGDGEDRKDEERAG